jgi:hypothetical protein
MTTRLIFALILVGAATTARAGSGLKEPDYQRALCAGMRLEVRLGEYGRADCVSDTHAIEVEWADKFKEGVGQALIYSTATQLLLGLILVCRRDEASCFHASLTAQETFSTFGIEATVWECGSGSRLLSDCVERHLTPNPDTWLPRSGDMPRF